MKKQKIVEVVTNEYNNITKTINDKIFNDLEINDGNVVIYHYSNVNITNGVITVRNERGFQSNAEFRAWGRDRAFFYLKKDGLNFDLGIGDKYLYISHYPVDKIYSMVTNPNKYNLSNLETAFQQSVNDGYTAWVYYLNKNVNAPILISFTDVKIDNALKKLPNGKYIDKEKINLDYIIGLIKLNGNKYFIYQPADSIISIQNTYYSKEREPEKAMNSYKENIEDYMKKYIEYLPKYKEIYETM